jgi:hypothetical protein
MATAELAAALRRLRRADELEPANMKNRWAARDDYLPITFDVDNRA